MSANARGGKVDTNDISTLLSSPDSPAYSHTLVNHNVYAQMDTPMTTNTTNTTPINSHREHQSSCLSSLAEFSPRSTSSDDSVNPAMISSSDLADRPESATDKASSLQKDSSTISSDGTDTRNKIPSKRKNSSAMNSRGASTDDDLDIAIDAEGIDITGLPSALIVANLPESLFRDADVKSQFESMYLAVDRKVQFGYFKCFRRARLAFSSPIIATRVRLISHGSSFCGNTIKCYFHESAVSSSPRQLEPPELEKQFLISPPASPPVGWEQNREHSPIYGAITPSVLPPGGGPITEDVVEAVHEKLILRKSPAANITGMELMAALAKLVPGEQTEILSPSDGTPGIVIETCEDNPLNPGGRKIQQTRCPERK